MDIDPANAESPEARAKRLAREGEMIAEARANVAAGRVVQGEAVLAWMESWFTEHELPIPRPDR